MHSWTTMKMFLLLLCENMYQNWRHHWSQFQRSSWLSFYASPYQADDPLQRTNITLHYSAGKNGTEHLEPPGKHHGREEERELTSLPFSCLLLDLQCRRLKCWSSRNTLCSQHLFNLQISLTLVFGFELPVAWSGPGGHGPGTEVGVLSGLRGQLQAHGGDVPLSDWNDVPAPSEVIQPLIPWYQARLDTFIELQKY